MYVVSLNAKRLIFLQNADRSLQNWYQNRRAKAKQQKRQEVVELTHLSDPAALWREFSSPSIQYQPNYQSSELASTPRPTPAGAYAAHPGYDTAVEASYPYDSGVEATYQSWQRALAAAEAARDSFSDAIADHNFESPQLLDASQPDRTFSNESNPSLIPASAFSDWSSSRTPSVIWTPAHQIEDPFENQNILLQQAPTPTYPQQSTTVQPPIDAEMFAKYQSAVEAHELCGLTQTSTSWSPAVKTERQTSSPLRIMPHPPLLLQETFSRRGSDSSELASNLGTIHIRQGQSQQSSDDDNFRVPAVPPQELGIAARRKKQRPAQLGIAAMRSYSHGGPLTMSPTTKAPYLGPQSVRRIKSTGHSLNVRSGRVQKPGLVSTQRSPLNFQTFAEAEAFQSANLTPPRDSDSSQMSPNGSNAPPTPHSQSGFEQQQAPIDWSTPCANQTTAMSWSMEHQCYVPTGYHGSPDATSPPRTPFTAEMLGHMKQYNLQYSSPPLSAPPQFTSFPQSSPSFPAAQPHPSSWNTPPMTFSDAYPYPSAILMPQPHHAMAEYHPHMGLFPGQPQFAMHMSPPIGAPHEFYGNGTPKEMEFVLQKFPEPKGAQVPPREPHRPKNYIFQNAGPNDF